ncbi:ATP synthase F0 subunit B [bacterium]|nr:ATP synthase F0 subunit B [bacterium]
MEFDAFGFFISILNFGVMFALFYHVVITPMEEAVVVRRKKVTSRLDEIRGTLAAAEKLEADVKSQFSKLEAEKAEMRLSTEHEIARIQEQLQTNTERDAQHLVAKTQRELDKNRQETLAALNRQLTDQAMSRVESLLTQALDSQAKASSASTVLGKVGARG